MVVSVEGLEIGGGVSYGLEKELVLRWVGLLKGGVVLILRR